MAKYCLAYDAKDALAWEPEELRLELAQLLLDNKAFSLESPTAGALVFEDDGARANIAFWANLLSRKFQADVYYYFCVVSSGREDAYLDRNEGDPELNASFQDALEDLEE